MGRRNFKLGVAGLILFFAAGAQAQVAKTTVTDTLVDPSGVAITGSIAITAAQTLTSADGFVVPQGQTVTVDLSTAGLFTVGLVPNIGATPTGTWYIASYRTKKATIKEFWIVPVSGGTVNLLAVRTLNPPSPGITIPFPQTVPPPQCQDQMVPVWIKPPGQWRCEWSNSGAVNFNLENPSVADSGKFQWKPKNSLTIKRLSCSVDAGGDSTATVDVNFEIRTETAPNAGGTPMLSQALRCTTSTGSTTDIANPNVPILSPVALVVAGTNGTPSSIVRIHADYQLNPSP